MVSRIRIGPEGGPFVEIDEDNGTLKLDAPSGDIDLQANDLLSLGDLDLTGNQLQNAVLLGATLGGALNADGQDIENIATVRSDDIENDQTVTTDSLSSTNINNADTINTQNIQPKNIGNGYHYAAAFDGADADARLDDALANISEGDTIYLENEVYTQDHQINTDGISLIGYGAQSGRGSHIENATFDFLGNFAFISNVGLNTTDGSAAIKLSFGCIATNIRQGGGTENGFIEAKVSSNIITHLKDVDVTLNADDCVVNSCVRTTVTDNGSNNAIGTIV
jgi:hypothetical protein